MSIIILDNSIGSTLLRGRYNKLLENHKFLERIIQEPELISDKEDLELISQACQLNIDCFSFISEQYKRNNFILQSIIQTFQFKQMGFFRFLPILPYIFKSRELLLQAIVRNLPVDIMLNYLLEKQDSTKYPFEYLKQYCLDREIIWQSVLRTNHGSQTLSTMILNNFSNDSSMLCECLRKGNMIYHQLTNAQQLDDIIIQSALEGGYCLTEVKRNYSKDELISFIRSGKGNIQRILAIHSKDIDIILECLKFNAFYFEILEGAMKKDERVIETVKNYPLSKIFKIL